MMLFRRMMVLCLCCLGSASPWRVSAAEQEPAADVPAASAATMERWRDLRFGMFVHWGPVSLKGTEIGWSRKGPRRGHARGGTGTIPLQEYDHLYEQFNPIKFDADQWVRIAKAAGMKYLVFTAKHHDGFSNFDSHFTDYKITSSASPYGKDICRQLADACHRADLALGWYYSPRDWYHKDFATERHDKYLSFYMGQLRELCTNYGVVDILWFDGLDSPREIWGDTPAESIRMIRSLQPNIVLNNRGGLPGDFDTPEQRVGGFNRDRPWETCMTICRQWAWKPGDQLKTLEQCLQTLLYTVGGDGNLLFNVGPMPDGSIEPRQVERLQEIGDWLSQHGDAVYGTRGGPFKPGKWGAATCRAHKVYLFIMQWPDDGPLQLPAIGTTIQHAARDGQGKLEWSQDESGIVIAIPPQDRDAIVTVVELTTADDTTKIEPVDVLHHSRSIAYAGTATASNVFQKTSRYDAAKVLDDDASTRWATDSGTRSAWLEVALNAPHTFDQIMIDEPAEFQRIEAFELQVQDEAGAWKTFHTGSQIGPQWKLQVRPLTAQTIRLNILKASDGPTLWEFQVYASH